MSYQKSIRSLNITIRDLRDSRDAWKKKFNQERKRRFELEAQLRHPPPRTGGDARVTSAAASPERC